MPDFALRMEHVYKKFRKGEIYNSLRDLIPALTGKMFRQPVVRADDKREFWALEDISFEVKRGEAFGIIGHNGAGKSTALKILSKIMKPTKGQMVVSGRLSALIEVSAGFHPDLTGRENIYLNGTILGMSRCEIESKLDQIIAFSGIEEFIDTPVKRYSSGMHARLGFSVAAHVDPDVLLVDEVLSVGDYAFQNKCIERMREVLRNGTTVLFVSHNLKTVSEFCQKCIMLDRGREVMSGPVAQVISAYLNRSSVSHLYDGSSKEVTISWVKIRNQYGECEHFRSGEKAWVDIEVTARTRQTKLSVSLYVLDDDSRCIFDTSTQRLGLASFTLEAGEVLECTFELAMNMTQGLFRAAVLVNRYDIQTVYDRWDPATTFYVDWDEDVRGPVHCFPKVIRQEIHPPWGTSLMASARQAGGPGKREAK